MALELTFAMVKPDAIKAGNMGKILAMIEENGFTIVRMQLGHMSPEVAEAFYAVHKDRPFFGELIEHITSGPVVILALAKDNAIQAWRDLMGATNPETANEGTIRKKFGQNIGNNAVHGSDAPQTAAQELGMFFPEFFEEPK
jgi:nucleoside-diphosphate kinase